MSTLMATMGDSRWARDISLEPSTGLEQKRPGVQFEASRLGG